MVWSVARIRISLVVVAVLAALVPSRAAATSVPVGGPHCLGSVVVLVHDVASNPVSMAPLARRLQQSGRCVVIPSYGGYQSGLPLGGMRAIADSAREIAGVIAEAARASGGRVDVVAHGAGSLVAQRAAAQMPGRVGTLVALGGAWRGTNVAFLGDLDLLSRRLGTYATVLGVEMLLMDRSCAVCREVIANSDYLQSLNARGVLVPGVRMVNVVTRYDELVVPYTSGTAPGMENRVLPATVLVEHLGLPASPSVGALVLGVLAG